MQKQMYVYMYVLISLNIYTYVHVYMYIYIYTVLKHLQLNYYCCNEMATLLHANTLWKFSSLLSYV